MGTGKQQAITITSSSGLSEDEIENMVKDAQKHSDEDKEKKEAIENKNKLDQLAYGLEKLLSENKDKIPESMITEVEESIKSAREAVNSEDNERIKAEIEKINQLSSKLSTELYKNAGPQPGEAGNTEPPAGDGEASEEDGEVIDAEYEDVDKGKDK
jgi:molecular chaperone DnaK